MTKIKLNQRNTELLAILAAFRRDEITWQEALPQIDALYTSPELREQIDSYLANQTAMMISPRQYSTAEREEIRGKVTNHILDLIKGDVK